MPREEIFLTSKLWNTHHPNVKEGLQKTLDSLGVDYLDLYVSLGHVIVAAQRQRLNETWTNGMNISLFTGPFDWYQYVSPLPPYPKLMGSVSELTLSACTE